MTARSTCSTVRARVGAIGPGQLAWPRVEGPRDRLAVKADLLAPSTASARAASRARSSAPSALRVARVATWRARAEASGPAASRISARRVEKARRCSSAKPSISAMPLRTGCHSTPRRLGQLVAQVGLVDVAGGLGVVVDRRVVEPGPAAVRSLGRVGDQDVGVELGIAGARGAVDDRRRRGSRCRGRTREPPAPGGSSRPRAAGSRGRSATASAWAACDLGGGDRSRRAPRAGRPTWAPRR